MKKAVAGFVKFKSACLEERQALFDELASGQSPEILFITCADSRIDPNLITQTDPGDLFVIRNAGNIAPAHVANGGGTIASIEFAVKALGVKHIVVCGHSDCGAMKGAINPAALTELPQVQSWLDHSRAAVESVKTKHGQATLDELPLITQENVRLQLQHLRTHPAVASKLTTGEVDLHGWVYDIGHGSIAAYDANADAFVDLEQCYADLL